MMKIWKIRGVNIKHLILLSTFTLLIAGCGSDAGKDKSVDSTNTIKDGLMAYYQFENNANDSSGHGNHGIEHGGISYVDGVIGKAAKFDGIDDWIQISQSGTLNNMQEKMTISFWTKYYKLTSGANNVSIHITNGYDKARNKEQGYFNYSGSEGIEFYLGYWGNAQHVDAPLDATKPLNEQEFVFISFVVDRETLKVYKNGVLVDEKVRTVSNISRPSNDWAIGSMFDRYYLNGVIDDLRIYNRSLNENEIQKIYKYGK